LALGIVYLTMEPRGGDHMRVIRVTLVVLLCLAASLLVSNFTYAQMAGTGQVVGTVMDASGAAIVGAEVTITDTTTNEARTTTTNDAGRYVFTNIIPGNYNITINKTGFRLAKLTDQKVVVSETRTYDVKLEIGSSNQVVEVTTTNTELQTMNATIGNTISGDALDALPGLGRDVSTFVSLQPGVAPDGSVAGANQDQNSFQLDGGNNSSDMDGKGRKK